MTMPLPKTLEEHREYLHEIVRLQLFFLHHWLTRHPEERFTDVLRDRVDLYRKTDFNSGGLNPAEPEFDAPQWRELERRAEALFDRCRDREPEFEEQAFELFRPAIDRRCERDFREKAPEENRCGFLRYESRLEAGTPEALLFHISNDMAPESFLDHPAHIRECFLQLLEIAERDFRAGAITTVTWLNELPKWRAIFPPEWLDNMGPRNTDVKWHYGFWGQFLTARGTFNARYGRILRETGELPFYPRTSHCSVTAMRNFLLQQQ